MAKKYGFPFKLPRSRGSNENIKLPKSGGSKGSRFKSEDQILLENLERRDRARKAREKIRKYWED